MREAAATGRQGIKRTGNDTDQRCIVLDRYRDEGLLILRVGIGIAFMCHGFPKLMAGPELWTKLGGALNAIGLDIAPTFMGGLAALTEFGGGYLLVFGLFTRVACFFLFCTMVVATVSHLSNGDSFMKYCHALEATILFLSLLFIGPGKISFDWWRSPQKENAQGKED